MIALVLQILVQTASAACPTFYGHQQVNGSWAFSVEKKAGMVEVQVDPATCEIVHEALELKSGKYEINQVKLAEIKAARAKEIADQNTLDVSIKAKREAIPDKYGTIRTLSQCAQEIDDIYLILGWVKPAPKSALDVTTPKGK